MTATVFAVAAFSLVTESINGLDCLDLLVLNDVDINVLGNFCIGVSKQFGNHLYFTAITEKHGRKRVAQCVYAGLGEV